jgi:hypothetical protein
MEGHVRQVLNVYVISDDIPYTCQQHSYLLYLKPSIMNQFTLRWIFFSYLKTFPNQTYAWVTGEETKIILGWLNWDSLICHPKTFLKAGCCFGFVLV